MATVAVFGVVRKFGSSLREGWLSVLQCMIRIGVVGLLPQMLANSTPDGISTEISQKHYVSVAYSNQFTKMNEVVDTKQTSNFFSWIFGTKKYSPQHFSHLLLGRSTCVFGRSFEC